MTSRRIRQRHDREVFGKVGGGTKTEGGGIIGKGGLLDGVEGAKPNATLLGQLPNSLFFSMHPLFILNSHLYYVFFLYFKKLLKFILGFQYQY